MSAGVVRVYGAIPQRQQARQTLAYSLDDILRIIGLAMSKREPANILLGANLVMNNTFVAPSKLSALTIDGGGRYTITVRGGHFRLFEVRCPTTLVDVDIVFAEGSSVIQCFGVGEEVPLTLERVSVDARRGQLTDAFGLIDTYATRLVIDNCVFREARNVFADDGGWPRRWDRCAIRDTQFEVDLDYAPSTTLGRGASSIALRQCEFSRINSALSVDLGLNSHQCVFSSIPAFAGLVTNSTGVFGHCFVACSIGGTPFLGGSDTWIGDATLQAPGVDVTVKSIKTSGIVDVGGNVDVAGDIDVGSNLVVSGGTTLATLTASGTANLSGGILTTTIRAANGNAASTAYAFSASPGNGAYLAAANDWRLAAGGTDNVRLTTSNTAISTAMSVAGAATFSNVVQHNDDVLATKFMSFGAQAITATGANYTITPTSSFVSVTFSSATGSLRISTTSIPVGTLLIVRCNTVTSTTATLPDSTVNGVILASAWTPTANGTLFLIFNGASWVEISRSAN